MEKAFEQAAQFEECLESNMALRAWRLSVVASAIVAIANGAINVVGNTTERGNITPIIRDCGKNNQTLALTQESLFLSLKSIQRSPKSSIFDSQRPLLSIPSQ